MDNNKQYFDEVPSTINCYLLGKELYKISENCIIYEGMNTYIDEKVLIKVYPKECIKRSLTEISLINNDIYLLKLLTHESILRLYEVIESYSYIFIITEYFQGVKISTFVKHNTELPENIAMVIYTELVNVMNYIHEMNISNLNINADSIYINENLDIKIFNFRYGYYYKNKETTISNFVGDPLYSSPEIHSKIPYYPESADVWSSGILLYFLLTGKMPFEGKTSILLDKAIMKGDYEITNNISNELDELLRNILNPKINNRYTFNEIINSQYFKKNGYNDICVNDGINIIDYSYPFNEKAIDIFVDYGLDSEILIKNLNKNHFNSFTSLYKLIEKNCGGYDKDNLYQKKDNKYIELINKYLNDNNKKKDMNSDIEKCISASQEEVLGEIKDIMDKSKLYSPKASKKESKILKKGTKVNNMQKSNFSLRKTMNKNNMIRKNQIELMKKYSCEVNANKNQAKSPNDSMKNTLRNSISSPKKAKNNESLKIKQKFRIDIDESGKRHSIILKLMEDEMMKKNKESNNYSPSPKKTKKNISLFNSKGNFHKLSNNKSNKNINNKHNNDNKLNGGIFHSKTFKKNNFKFKGISRVNSLKCKNLPNLEKKIPKFRNKEIQEKITEENVKEENKEKEEKKEEEKEKEDSFKIEEENKEEEEKKKEEKNEDDSISIDFSNSSDSDKDKNKSINKNNESNSVSNKKNNEYSQDANHTNQKITDENEDEEEFTGPIYKRFNMLTTIYRSPPKEKKTKKPIYEPKNNGNEKIINHMNKKNVSFKDNKNSYSKDLSLNSTFKLSFNSPKIHSKINTAANRSIDSRDEKINNTIYELNDIFKNSQIILNKPEKNKQNKSNYHESKQRNKSKKEMHPITKNNKINNYGKAHKVKGNKAVIKQYILKSDEYDELINNYSAKINGRNTKKHNSHKKKEKITTPRKEAGTSKEKKKNKNASCKILNNINLNTNIKQKNDSLNGIKNLKNSRKKINYVNTNRSMQYNEEKQNGCNKSYRNISNRNIIQQLQKKNLNSHFPDNKNGIAQRTVYENELDKKNLRNSLYRDISNRDVIKKIKNKNNKASYENINFNINVNIITSEQNTTKNKKTRNKLIKKIANYEDILTAGLSENRRINRKFKHEKHSSCDDVKSNYTKSTRNKKISAHQSYRSYMSNISYPTIPSNKKNMSYYSSEKEIKAKIIPFKKS